MDGLPMDTGVQLTEVNWVNQCTMNSCHFIKVSLGVSLLVTVTDVPPCIWRHQVHIVFKFVNVHIGQ